MANITGYIYNEDYTFNDTDYTLNVYEAFSPLTSIINCQAAYATHRIDGVNAAINIMQVRRVTAEDTVNIWDFQPSTSNYKLTSEGSWIDGSAETFYIVTLYDQSGNSKDLTQATEDDQPQLFLNTNNSYPVIDFEVGSTMSLGSESPVLNTVAGFSMIAKFKNESADGNGGIYEEWKDTDEKVSWVAESGNSEFVYVANTANAYTRRASKPAGNWFNDLIVYDGSEVTENDRVKMYWDNSLQTMAFYSGTFPATTATGMTNATMGAYNYSSPIYSDIQLSNFFIYTTVVSGTERSDLQTYLSSH